MGFLCLGPAAKYEVDNEVVANLQRELQVARQELEQREDAETKLLQEREKMQRDNRDLQLQLVRLKQAAAATIVAPSEDIKVTPKEGTEAALRLIKENEELKAENSRLQADLKGYEAHHAEVLQTVLTEKRDLAKQLKSKAEECTTLQQQRDQLKEIQTQFEQLKAQLKSAEGAHSVELQELRQSLDAAQAINDSTASSTSKLMSDYSALQAKYNQSQNELKLKDDMLGLLQQQLSEIADMEESKLKNAPDTSMFRNLTMPIMKDGSTATTSVAAVAIH